MLSHSYLSGWIKDNLFFKDWHTYCVCFVSKHDKHLPLSVVEQNLEGGEDIDEVEMEAVDDTGAGGSADGKPQSRWEADDDVEEEEVRDWRLFVPHSVPLLNDFCSVSSSYLMPCFSAIISLRSY